MFTYTSYRQLIRDFHKEKKAENPGFSYQVFANAAGVGSKQALLGILSGNRPLPKTNIFNMAKAMNLSKRETDYFEALVNYNDAKKDDDKTQYYERLNKIAGKSAARHIGRDQYRYFSQWYHVVIRELVAMEDYNGNFDALAKRVVPRITKKQAEESVKLLLDLGLIQKAASGKFKQTDVQVSTGDELKSIAAFNHQQETMKLASEAHKRFSKEERDISSLSVSIPHKCFPVFKKEIQLFRKSLLAIADEYKEDDMVYQINFQLFPLTEPPKKE